MGLTFGLIVLWRVLRSVGGQAHFGIATVTVGASQPHSARAVHGGSVGGGVAGDATGGFAVGLGLGLQQEDIGRCLRMGENLAQEREA